MASYQGVFFEEQTSRNAKPCGKHKFEKYYPSMPYYQKQPSIKASLLTSLLELAPTFCVIALGAVFLPHFSLALAIGTVNFILTLVIIGILALFIPNKPVKQEYIDFLLKNPLYVTLMGPVLEELIFRGTLLNIAIFALICVIPCSATLPFFGTGLSIAVASSLLVTSLGFGLCHFPGSESIAQVVGTTSGGIVFGLLAIQFGLTAAIGAHIMNNVIVMMLLKLEEYSKKIQEKPNAGHESANSPMFGG